MTRQMRHCLVFCIACPSLTSVEGVDSRYWGTPVGIATPSDGTLPVMGAAPGAEAPVVAAADTDQVLRGRAVAAPASPAVLRADGLLQWRSGLSTELAGVSTERDTFERGSAQADQLFESLLVSSSTNPTISAEISASQVVIVILVVGFFYLMWRSTSIMGKLIETAIEKLDKSVLGVDVKINSTKLNPFYGTIEIKTLVICNPEFYTSDYILKMDSVYVNIGMLSMMRSFFGSIYVEKLEAKGVHVIFEKSLTSSNAQDIIDFMKKRRAPNAQAGLSCSFFTCGAGGGSHKEGNEEDDEDSAKEAKRKKKAKQIYIEKFDLTDVKASVVTGLLGGLGADHDLQDIKYENYTEHIGGYTHAGDICRETLKELLGVASKQAGVSVEIPSNVIPPSDDPASDATAPADKAAAP